MTIDPFTPWVIQGELSEPLQRAMQDVQRDWYGVLGRNPLILSEEEAFPHGVLTIWVGVAGAWLDDFAITPPTERETFLIAQAVGNDGKQMLLVTGADVRGTIYALYAFSEHVLGVNPWWYWTDLVPARKNQIPLDASFCLDSGSPAFRWRGWFINDEDLLNGFAPDPLRENVFSLEMYDRIYETILRLRGNMVTPATFPFPDERCHELASRRGLAINTHHVLPLGLNTYRWPEDRTYSFTTDPDLLEKCWRTSARALADKEVVWTIGLRGKYDHPIWVDDRELSSEEATGKIISEAMALQVSIIREIQPDAEIIANLWEEGAILYGKSLLHLPEGVIAVWPDHGNGILGDRGKIAEGDGVYVHTAMFSVWQNQLTEMVAPARIFQEFGRCLEAGANSFFLLNVSDIRPVPLTTDCAMKIAWHGKKMLDESTGQHSWLLSWCRNNFGEAEAEKMAGLYEQYFAAPTMQDRERTFGENFFPRWASRFYYDVIEAAHAEDRESPWATVLVRGNQPAPIRMKFAVFQDATLDYVENLAGIVAGHFGPLLQLAREIPIPEARKEFHHGHLVLQTSLHFHLAGAVLAFLGSIRNMADGKFPEAKAHIENALQLYRQLQMDIYAAEYGQWRGWFRGDKMVRLEEFEDTLRAMHAAVIGTPPPPRKHWPVFPYPEICSYQEPFLKNFPLLYSSHPHLKHNLNAACQGGGKI